MGGYGDRSPPEQNHNYATVEYLSPFVVS